LVFEVVVDRYAEVWMNGAMSLTIGTVGWHVVAGVSWSQLESAGVNALNRAVLTRDARDRPSPSRCAASTGLFGRIKPGFDPATSTPPRPRTAGPGKL
jgi:hypothetical protein